MRGSRFSYLANEPRFYVTFSIVCLAIITLMNVAGLDVGKWLHNIGAVAMWLPAMIIIGMGLLAWNRFGPATPFTPITVIPSAHLKDMIFWSSLIFAFGG